MLIFRSPNWRLLIWMEATAPLRARDPANGPAQRPFDNMRNNRDFGFAQSPGEAEFLLL